MKAEFDDQDLDEGWRESRPARVVASLGLTAEDRSILEEVVYALRHRTEARWNWGQPALADVVLFDARASEADLERLPGGIRRVFVARSGAGFAPIGSWLLRWPPSEQGVLEALEGSRNAAPMERRIIDLGGGKPREPANEASLESLFDPGMIADVPSGILRADEERTWLMGTEDLGDLSKAELPIEAEPETDDSPAGRLARRLAPLADYLRPNGLPGPARLQAAGVPTLVVDPRERVFHAAAELPEFDLPMLGLVSGSDWTLLKRTELQRAAGEHPARPLAWLLFVNALLNPRLPADVPGPRTQVRLTDHNLVDAYPQYHKLLGALAEGSTAAAASEASGIKLDETLNVVAALETTGLLQRS